MSIIYDALKKSQQKRATTTHVKVAVAKQPGKIRQGIVITLLILTCLFTILMAASMPGNKLLIKPMLGKTETKVKPLVPAKRTAFIIPKMRLTGVFLSDREKMALINNKSYHLGDKIHGMKIVSISLEKVRLKNKKRTITLRNSMAQ